VVSFHTELTGGSVSKKEDFRKQLEEHAKRGAASQEMRQQRIATFQGFHNEVLSQIKEWAADLPGLTIQNLQRVQPPRGSTPEVRVFNLDIVVANKQPFRISGLSETHVEFFGPEKCAVLKWELKGPTLYLVASAGDKEKQGPGPAWNEDSFIQLLQDWLQKP
jgi:hypothetical protein